MGGKSGKREKEGRKGRERIFTNCTLNISVNSRLLGS